VAGVMMSVMHEQVHERTRQEQQEWQYAEKVRPVFREHKEGRYGAKAE